MLDDEPNARYQNILSESQGMMDNVRDHFVDLKPFKDNWTVIKYAIVK